MTDHQEFTDRSRQERFQTCPRSRFLEYHLMGTGIRRIRATIPLATGTYVHRGVADVLQQVLAQPDQQGAHLRIDVERAVKAAVEGYRAEIKARGLDVELGEDAQAVADEQVALTEGLVRAFVKAPSGLEALLRSYRIVEVEHEDVWLDFVAGVTMQARADALLMEHSTNDLYVFSLKTAATSDYRKENENRHDVQGLSEVAVVERRLGDWWVDVHHSERPSGDWTPEMWKLLHDLPDKPRIMGVQMCFLYKGQRRQSYDGGPYVTSSPLLRGWYKEGVGEREYAWKEETPCPGPGHVLSYGKRGPVLCEGKKFHKLGQGWTKFSTYDAQGQDTVGGVKGWIDTLASGVLQPDAGDALESIVWMPVPYFRQDRDVEDWLEQTKAQEMRVVQDADFVEQIRADDPDSLRHVLNSDFPQHRRACDWPSACQFIPVCYGDDTMLTSPFASGLFQRRVPHHAPELQAKAHLVTISDLQGGVEST